ncbi:MAG: TonB-dependent receptor domain-containing protein [bacterium]
MKRSISSSTFLAILILAAPVFASVPPGSIAGKVTGKATGKALVGANIKILGTLRGTTTGLDGTYTIPNIPPGSYTLRVSMIGYRTETLTDIEVTAGAQTRVDISLEQTAIPLSEIVVTPGHFRIKDEVKASDRVMGVREVWDTPGSAADILQVIQAMPGIASTGDEGVIYVRGGTPEENLVLYDNAPVSDAFWIQTPGGGLFSIFPMDIISDVELLTGGFPAEYGDRLSAVLDVKVREGSRAEMKGTISTSMAYAGLTLEGPLSDKGSFICSARRTYYDLVMEMMEMEEEGEVFDVIPNYYDLQGKLALQLSPNHKLSLTGFGGRDGMEMFQDQPGFRGDFSWESHKSIISLELQSLFGQKAYSRFTLARSDNSWQRKQGTQWYWDQSDLEYWAKGDLVYAFSPRHEIKLGSILSRLQFGLTRNKPPYRWGELTDPGQAKETVSARSYKGAWYLQDRWRIGGPLSAMVGGRYDHFWLTGEGVFSPRLTLACGISQRTALYGAWGHYYQFPRFQDLDPKTGNPKLKARKATHYVLGLESKFGEDLSLRIESYYKDLERLVSSDSLTNYTNEGFGRARGIELFFQKRRGKLFGWLSYGLSLAKRKEYEDRREYCFDFDQRHILSLVANYKLGEKWQLGIKWRYASGRPLTPLADAAYDSTEGWIPKWGEPNSGRYPDYHRLDVRVLRDFNLKGLEGTFFLELFNVYNHKNVVFYQWYMDFSGREEFILFSFLPVAGVIADF